MSEPYQEHQHDSHTLTVRCAVITLSDTRGLATDTSGQLIVDLLTVAGHHLFRRELMKDEPAELRARLEALLAEPALDAIFTTGGTGISRRDSTIAVVESLLDLPLPGFGELFRMLSHQQIGSGAMLSRAVGGVARGKLIFAMPGSTKAVDLAMQELILPELRHLVHQLQKN